MKPAFPRLLVATEFPPNASGGGPAVVRQMLHGWPANSVSWWSCRPDSHQRFGRDVAHHFVADIPEKLYPRTRMTRLKAQVLQHAWAGWAATRLRAAISVWKPDVIWTIPHQWSILPLARVLPSAVPFHVSIHDYPDAHRSAERIGASITTRLVSQIEELYRQANSRDAISEEMAADLETRTGQPADQILHAGLEPEDFTYLEQKTSSARETIKVAYAGTIIAEQSFTILVEGLARIRQRLPNPLELHLFGAHCYERQPWFDRVWMTQRGDLGVEELRTALQTFDWGFAPMELTDENPRYNRYSLPTKIVSYLAAGLAIISVGHASSTVARLARQHALGIAIEETNLGEVDDLLLTGLAEADVWSRYARAIVQCTQQKFDATAMKTELFARLGIDRA